jgi:hypothetical protein
MTRYAVGVMVALVLMSFTSVRAQGQAPKGKLIQVFSGEKDACQRDNVVSVPGRDGRVEVKRGETKWVVFETMKATFYWRCGDTEEKWEYGDVQPFNCIKVERTHDTGRISWTCYVFEEK